MLLCGDWGEGDFGEGFGDTDGGAGIGFEFGCVDLLADGDKVRG
jgi:hypothetical protein